VSIAGRLKWYLDANEVEYEVLPHPRSNTTVETARKADVPLSRIAKSVLLEDERGYVMAIVPGSHRVDVARLGDQLHRELELASETELAALFHDCARGAVPPLGRPYRIPTVFDDSLSRAEEVYFEAGDHEDVVHMRTDDFLTLLSGSKHGSFSRPA
jgi:Ala-tRNA(Pro) deacylase